MMEARRLITREVAIATDLDDGFFPKVDASLKFRRIQTILVLLERTQSIRENFSIPSVYVHASLPCGCGHACVLMTKT